MMDTKDLGLQIKECRKRKSISAAALSEQVGLSEFHLREIERGAACPSVSALVAISNGLQVRLSQLLQSYLKNPTLSDEPVCDISSLTPYSRNEMLRFLDVTDALLAHHMQEEKLKQLQTKKEASSNES